MSQLYHQQHILHLMGIQPYVETNTPTQKNHYSLWRDAVVNDSHSTALSASIQPMIEATEAAILLEQKKQKEQKSIDSSSLSQFVVQDVKISDTEDTNTQHKVIATSCLAICQSEHFILLAEFDEDIQKEQISQREDVQLWYNIQKFIQQTHQKHFNTQLNTRILIWNYHFIDLESQESIRYFQKGYLDVISQQKKVIVLGDTLLHHQPTWQVLPCLSTMIRDIDSKRQCHQTLLELFI